MKILPSSCLRKSSPSRLKRITKIICLSFITLATLIMMIFGGLYLRLMYGPLDTGKMPRNIAQQLTKVMQPGWSVSIKSSSLQLYHGSPALWIDDLRIKNPEGFIVVRAEHAAVAISLSPLLTGQIKPRAFEMEGAQFRLQISKNGTLSILPETSEPEIEKDQYTSESPYHQSSDDNSRITEGTPVSAFLRQTFEQIFGQDSPLYNLDYARISNSKLTIENSEKRVKAHFDNVQATIEWLKPQTRQIQLSIQGQRGEWHVYGELNNSAEKDYGAKLLIKQAPIQDILLFSGSSTAPLTTTMNASGHISIAIKQNILQQLEGELEGHSGTLQLHDKDASLITVDGIHIGASWSELENTLVLKDATFKSGQTHVSLDGIILFGLPDIFAQLQLNGKEIQLEGLTKRDTPISINHAYADISVHNKIEVKELILKGPSLDASLQAVLGKENDPRGFNLTLQAKNTDGRTALRIWPEMAAAKVRAFLVERIQEAHVTSLDLELDFSGQDIEGAISGKGLPKQAMAISFDISHGKMLIHDGLPILSNINVVGIVDGTSTYIQADAKVPADNKRTIFLSNGDISIQNFWNKKEQAVITFDASGNADALGAFLHSPAIRSVTNIDTKPEQLSGKVQLSSQLSIPLRNPPDFPDLPIHITGTLTDFSHTQVFSDYDFENGKLDISYKNGDISITGAGKILGAPADILVQQKNSSGHSIIKVSLDDAVRKKMGFSVGDKLNGPVNVHITAFPDKEKKIHIEADMSQASVNQLLPGWNKAAGKEGKISFTTTLSETGTISINDLKADAGSLQLKGAAELTKDYTLKKADFSIFKLSPGDDMKVLLEQSGTANRVVVRGNTADVRALLKFNLKDFGISANSSQSNGNTSINLLDSDLDLDVAINIVTGFSNEALTKVNLKSFLQKGIPQKLEFQAMLGSASVSAYSTAQNKGTLISLKSEDAGRLLRFLGLYPHAYEGNLYLNTTFNKNGSQSGTVVVDKIIIRNESSLKKIIPTQTRTLPSRNAQGKVELQVIDINEVLFNRARAEFSKRDGLLSLKDVAIWGNHVGFTLSGNVDFRKDKTNISGTYIPAYGLNNAIANVPLFGPILGGGSNEGLVGVNFRIQGPVSSPELTVSPLSAITPGIFRKIFGEIEKQGTTTNRTYSRPNR